jgi:hypothetical protein
MRSIPGTEGTLSRRAAAFYMQRALKARVPYRIHGAARRLRGPSHYAPDWMRPEAAAAYAETDDRHAWKRVSGPRWFAQQVWRVVRGMGPALAYDHIRRRAALAGLEPRHPLVDVDVIEFTLRLPPALAFDPERTRPLLRRAMEGLLPDAIRLRPTKSHFDAVFHEALAGPDLPVAQALLTRADAEVGAYADLGKVAELVRNPPETPHERMWWALHVWRLVTAECWLAGQEDAEAVDRLLPGPLPEPDIELSTAPPVRVAG